MQKRCKSSLWFLFFFIFIASSLRSSVPGQMNYQGRMFNLGTSIPVPDSSGNSMTFSVYNVASGGTPLWSETQNGSVTTKNGLFNVILGKTTPLNLPFDVPYWLEVTFNGQLMSPRQPLVTAPYAFHAAVADNASVSAPLNLSTGTTSAVFQATNTGTGLGIIATGVSFGISATASSSTGSAIYGRAASNTGAIYGINDGSGGYGVYGQSNGGMAGVYGQGGSQAGVYGSSSGAPYGVEGFAVAGSIAGVYGNYTSAGNGAGVLGQGSSGAGVSGTASSSSGMGVAGYNSSGFGIEGFGLTGTAGVAAVNGGVGILAWDGGNTNSLALRTFGNSIFDGVGNTAIFHVYVSFTAGTNLAGGLPGPAGSISNPLSLTNSVAGPVISGGNLGAGSGLSGTSSSGFGVYAQGVTALAASGSLMGISVTASGTSAIGIYSDINSNDYAIKAYNDSASAGGGLYGNVISGNAVYALSTNGVGVNANSNSNTGVYGYTAGNGMSGIFGVAPNGSGVSGSGITGTAGSPSGAGGIGIFASDGGYANAKALYSKGNATFDGFGNTVTFNAYVSFTAGTNLGASGGVPNPLSLTGNVSFPDGVITATNTGSGFAVIGYATKPGSVVGGAPDFNDVISAGVKGYTAVSNSAGVIGYSYLTYGAGAALLGIGYTGVGGIGRADIWGSTGGYFSSNAASGAGVQASAQNGVAVNASGVTAVAASTNYVTGTALVASNNFGGLAIHSFGNSIFDGGGNTVTFNTYVSFTAGTNLGAGGGVPNPLSLTGNVSFPGGVITASNTGSGHGLVGYANTPGSFGNGPTPSSLLVGGVTGYTSASNSAGVLGFSTLTYTSGAGVAGIGYVGMYAAGRVDVPASVGIRAEGETVNGVGVSADAGLGTAVNAQGLTGVAAISNLVTGTALVASNNFGGLAIHSFGNGIFDGGGNTVTFNTYVSFTAGTNLATNINPPLVLSANLTGPVLSSTNTGFGPGIFASNPGFTGLAVQGGTYGITSTATTSAQVNAYGVSASAAANYYSTFGGANAYGLYASASTKGNGDPAYGVYGIASAPASPSYGVYGDNSSVGGYGVYGNNSGTGVGVQGTSANGIGVIAQGNTVGLSVTASSLSGVGIYSRVNATNSYAIEGINDNAVSGSAGVYGQGIYGVFGQSSSGYGMIAAGGAIGLSATTTSLSGNAIYARASSSAETIRGQNDDTTTASFGVHGLAKNTGIGVYGEVLSPAAGSAGMEGHNTFAGGYGVWADNASASVGSGGAALFVNGPLKVSSTAYTDNSGNGTPAGVSTINTSAGRIIFNVGKTIPTPGGYGPFNCSTNVLSSNSVVLVTFKTSTATFAASTVVNSAGTSFIVYLYSSSANVIFSAGDQMNFAIISQ